MSVNLFPPRKKDWKPGTFQIGYFVRTPEGTVLECVRDNASRAEAEHMMEIMVSPAAERVVKEGANGKKTAG